MRWKLLTVKRVRRQRSLGLLTTVRKRKSVNKKNTGTKRNQGPSQRLRSPSSRNPVKSELSGVVSWEEGCLGRLPGRKGGTKNRL